MNRVDLQRLSRVRIREARILFDAGEYSGAYYLAGYAVECALKACYTKTVKRYDFPLDRVNKVFTHKLKELLQHAYLQAELDAEKKTNPTFSAYWDEVAKWSEESRYSIWTKDQAESLLQAISGRKDGVLAWIKQRW